LFCFQVDFLMYSGDNYPLRKSGEFIMKALSLRKMSFVIGIALGIVALWAAAAPIATSADTLVGGWGPMSGCPTCFGVVNQSPFTDCENAEYEGENMGCTGGTATICDTGGSGPKCCGADDNIPCSGTGESHPLCFVSHDATCNTGNCP
jgi:hypothetical protein